MNNFLEEKEKLLNSIENNTPNHWKEYYKNVPLDCIFDDLVLDVNEIKRLAEENQKHKEVIDKSYIRVMHLLDYYDHYRVLPKSIIEELINLQIDLDILKEVE